ncbi:hypothetical protein LL14B4_10540 [Lactococcus lactis subsp. lactis]|uniref:Uncharacterized protein n=1 Tax=Lactococcus lactis subsp. lactis TaxID=1360 RepID=A0A2Z3KRM8_LACLL|nr:hypothetical protein [Lactococcus lactis]AWN66589.1 hypothetical protein LL14B4_10540 [Lactococcus lactis subsp. lactis]
MIDNKIKHSKSKRIQTITQVVIIGIAISLLFIIYGMLSGLETKTISSSTKIYKNIVLDSSTDISGKHYPYTLNRNNVYEPLVDKNMNSGDLREIKYIAEDQKPYATVETKVTKQFYRSSKYPLTNIGRSLGNFVISLKNERHSWKSVTVYQPVNYKKFIDFNDRW